MGLVYWPWLLKSVESRFLNLICSWKLFKFWLENQISFVCPLRDVWPIIQISAWRGCQVETQSFVTQLSHFFFCEHFGQEPNCSRTKMFKNWGLIAFLRCENHLWQIQKWGYTQILVFHTNIGLKFLPKKWYDGSYFQGYETQVKIWGSSMLEYSFLKHYPSHTQLRWISPYYFLNVHRFFFPFMISCLQHLVVPCLCLCDLPTGMRGSWMQLQRFSSRAFPECLTNVQ